MPTMLVQVLFKPTYYEIVIITTRYLCVNYEYMYMNFVKKINIVYVECNVSLRLHKLTTSTIWELGNL